MGTRDDEKGDSYTPQGDSKKEPCLRCSATGLIQGRDEEERHARGPYLAMVRREDAS